jgi:hypothetical protein
MNMFDSVDYSVLKKHFLSLGGIKKDRLFCICIGCQFEVHQDLTGPAGTQSVRVSS